MIAEKMRDDAWARALAIHGGRRLDFVATHKATESSQFGQQDSRGGNLLREYTRIASLPLRTVRRCPAACGGEIGRQMGSSAEVHFVRCLAREGRVWHLSVVLLDVEVDQGAETLDGIRGVEVFSPSCARIQCLPVAVTG